MTTATLDDLSLTVTRHLAAPPERVWRAWLDPATLMRVFANGKGFHLDAAETDPRDGGGYRLSMNFGGTALPPHTGEYLDLRPFSRMVFTWRSQSSTLEGSAVTVDLAPDGDGTMVTLTHRGFTDPALRDRNAGGWSMILDAFAATDL
jgi:uncharacterized protein YndB with AHSA1/START domain